MNRVYGATGNPFDPVKTCAGSSGGSAVALALGQVPLATGSDYGGSLRTPAAFCGVAGFRPSPGVVPGETRAALLVPFAVSGPMGRTIEDAHLLLMAQADVDKGDPFSSNDCLSLPSKLGNVDLGSVPRRVLDRPRLCADRSRHRQGVQGADVDLPRRIRRGYGPRSGHGQRA